MVELTLPQNSKISRGKEWPAPAGAKKTRTFKIYRYDPESGKTPRWDTYRGLFRVAIPRDAVAKIEAQAEGTEDRPAKQHAA